MKYMLMIILFIFAAGCTPGVSVQETTATLESTTTSTTALRTTTTLPETTTTLQSTTTIPTTSTTTTTEKTGITEEELFTHNMEDDCWISYQGNVYDITEWLPRHPGGSSAISRHCGTSEDFERAFTTQHGIGLVGRLEKEGIFRGKLS